MSLILNTEPCSICHIEQIPYGRLGPTGTKKCTKCKNHIQNDRRRILQKVRRLHMPRFCRRCSGRIMNPDPRPNAANIYCTDYCKWLNTTRRLKESTNRIRRKYDL